MVERTTTTTNFGIPSESCGFGNPGTCTGERNGTTTRNGTTSTNEDCYENQFIDLTFFFENQHKMSGFNTDSASETLSQHVTVWGTADFNKFCDRPGLIEQKRGEAKLISPRNGYIGIDHGGGNRTWKLKIKIHVRISIKNCKCPEKCKDYYGDGVWVDTCTENFPQQKINTNKQLFTNEPISLFSDGSINALYINKTGDCGDEDPDPPAPPTECEEVCANFQYGDSNLYIKQHLKHILALLQPGTQGSCCGGIDLDTPEFEDELMDSIQIQYRNENPGDTCSKAIFIKEK